jgi:plasmid stabilization system protein ParE
VKVTWTESAVAHLQAIHDHIALNSLNYALGMIDRIVGRSEQLANQPTSGQVVREYNTPEIREVFERPFRVIYRILPDRVDVLAVIHAARRLPPSMGGG